MPSVAAPLERLPWSLVARPTTEEAEDPNKDPTEEQATVMGRAAADGAGGGEMARGSDTEADGAAALADGAAECGRNPTRSAAGRGAPLWSSVPTARLARAALTRVSIRRRA